MARRHRRSRHHSRNHFSLSRLIFPLAFGISTVQQVTQKEIQGNAVYANADGVTKAKIIGAATVKRFTGINLMPTALSNTPFAINPTGPINKWTGLGIVAMIFGSIPQMPARGKIKNFGKGALLGGIIGGLFDDPPVRQNGGYGSMAYSNQGSVLPSAKNTGFGNTFVG